MINITMIVGFFIGWTCGRVIFDDESILNKVFALLSLGGWIYLAVNHVTL